MSIPILPGGQVSHNTPIDVKALAELFSISFSYFRCHHSLYVIDFIREIRTMAGLGLTAVLSDEGYLYPYKTYFDEFIQGNKGDFREDLGEVSFRVNPGEEVIKSKSDLTIT